MFTRNMSFTNNFSKFCVFLMDWSFILECDPGFYGKHCIHNCSENCNVTGSCDRFFGECEGGCKPGWTGITCKQSVYQANNYLNKLNNYLWIKILLPAYNKCSIRRTRICEWYDLTPFMDKLNVCKKSIWWKAANCSVVLCAVSLWTAAKLFFLY